MTRKWIPLVLLVLLLLLAVAFCLRTVPAGKGLARSSDSELQVLCGPARTWVWPWQSVQTLEAPEGRWTFPLAFSTADDTRVELEVTLAFAPGSSTELVWPPGEGSLEERLSAHQESYARKAPVRELIAGHGPAGWLAENLPGNTAGYLYSASFTNLSEAFQQKALAEPLRALSEPRPPVLLVGWDGADWNFADPMMKRGELPNLKALVDAGSSGTLISEEPIFSPMLWTTMATGVTPDRHGILDFVMIDVHSKGEAPVSSLNRRVPALWNMFDAAGKKSAFVAWWATYPAEEVAGAMVSDRLYYQLFGSKPGDLWASDLTYPQDLLVGLALEPLSPEDLSLDFMQRFIPGLTREELDEAMATASQEGKDQHLTYKLAENLAKAENYHRLSLALWDQLGPLDLISPYYQAIDEIAHRFMKFQLPAHPWEDPAEGKQYRQVMDETYRLMDDYLGDWLQRFDLASSNVVVVSDHGFYSGHGKPRHSLPNSADEAQLWHNLHGMFAAGGPGFKPGVRGSMDLVQVTPLMLALAGMPQARDFASPAPDFMLQEPAGRKEQLESYTQVVANTWQLRKRDQALDPEAERQMIENLIALGYISPDALSGTDFTNLSDPNRKTMSAADYVYRPMAYLNLGVVLQNQDRLEEADQQFRDAMASPLLLVQNVRLMALLGLAYGRGDIVYPKVKEFIEAAEPEQQAHLYDVFGEAAVGAGRLQEAWDIFQSLEGREVGSDRWAIGRAHLIHAREGAPKALDFLFGHLLDHSEQMEVARMYFHLADSSGALPSRSESFARWAATAPDGCRTRVWAASGLLLADREGEAVKLLNQAQSRNPAAAREALDVADAWAGRHPGASEVLDRWLLEKAPWYARAWMRQARRAQSEGRVEDARRYFGEVLRLNPKDAEAELYLKTL